MAFKISLMNDEEILIRIRKGDERAVDFLYKKHYRMMVNMITKNSGSEEEAKDIYQEALIVFWRKAVTGELVLTSKISTYLYSICQNLWRKELDRKTKLSYEEKDAVTHLDHDQNEKIAIVNRCINELGDTCRKVLTYFYFEEMSMDDIAQKMGFANADTAKTKKYKCKVELDRKVKSLFSSHDFFD
jgi:RNA polymerase sigma factor (sigma-70 family)